MPASYHCTTSSRFGLISGIKVDMFICFPFYLFTSLSSRSSRTLNREIRLSVLHQSELSCLILATKSRFHFETCNKTFNWMTVNLHKNNSSRPYCIEHNFPLLWLFSHVVIIELSKPTGYVWLAINPWMKTLITRDHSMQVVHHRVDKLMRHS